MRAAGTINAVAMWLPGAVCRYKEPQRSEILDWMFKPGYGASLDILKVEVGSDDQTTDGCEACHMRSPTEVDCHVGYEWGIMKEAVKRNPKLTLYGLPWAWAGWLGMGTNSPYANVTATADYTARWVECGRDAHGLNISVIGLSASPAASLLRACLVWTLSSLELPLTASAAARWLPRL